MRLVVILVSAAVLGFAAAGCGGGGGGDSSSGTKPETWATDVCGALLTWQKDLTSGSQQLGTDIRNSRDVKSVKTKLVAFLQDAGQSTEKMVDDVKSAGAPDVKDGAAIQNDLETGLSQASASFQHAVTQAKKLPTNNPQALAAGLGTLAQTIQSELTATGNRFSSLDTKYDTTELKQAMADEPSCKSFVRR
jgi:hypothetical protein